MRKAHAKFRGGGLDPPQQGFRARIPLSASAAGKGLRMNRLSHLFGKPSCKCCRVRRKLRRMAAEVNAVEKLIGSVAEFLIPSVGSYLNGERRQVRLFITLDCEPAKPGTDLAQYAAAELRRVAGELLCAAERAGGAS